MVSVIIIPIIIVTILGLSGYMIYRYALFDALCKRSVTSTLKKYNIQKTPSQIIQEYHTEKGQTLSDSDVKNLEKQYRQKDPGKFLEMYDSVRGKRDIKD